MKPPVTHCIRGHEFTEANTYVGLSSRGGPQRQCRSCRTARQQASRAKTPPRRATKTPEEMDAAVLRRLREAWSEGVAERDLAGRFGMPLDRIKAAVVGVGR